MVNLQQVPSVLHGPAEAGGQRRTGRSLQEAVRHVSSPLYPLQLNSTKVDLPFFGRFSFCRIPCKRAFGQLYYNHEEDTFDRHGRHHRLREYGCRPCAHHQRGRIVAGCAGAQAHLRAPRRAGTEHRQHGHDARRLAGDLRGYRAVLRRVRRLRGGPRHGHHGLHGGGAQLSRAPVPRTRTPR